MNTHTYSDPSMLMPIYKQVAPVNGQRGVLNCCLPEVEFLRRFVRPVFPARAQFHSGTQQIIIH